MGAPLLPKTPGWSTPEQKELEMALSPKDMQTLEKLGLGHLMGRGQPEDQVGVAECKGIYWLGLPASWA